MSMNEPLTYGGALGLLTIWFVCVQGGPGHAQLATLPRACKGTQWERRWEDREPVALGIVVNFTTRTVQGGYGAPGMFPATIKDADDVTIWFEGVTQDGPVVHGIDGFILHRPCDGRRRGHDLDTQYAIEQPC